MQDKAGATFKYANVDPIPESLHWIDQQAAGRIEVPEQILNPETRDQYYIGSLIEEAITSSQLEGASTTREVAKEMIRAGRDPRDVSERMILNNYLTMRRLAELKKEPMTRDLLLEIHRLVTEDTLDDPSGAGRFRTPEEEVKVWNGRVVAHEPPAAEELEERVESMSNFANGTSPDTFLHPVLRAIILHFWLGYDHPFKDGNGRTARALFYWSMLRNNYWLCEFLSISNIILKAPAKYARSFLLTETDDNDLTYFLLYHLRVIRRSIDGLHGYIARKAGRLRVLERELQGLTALNHRQRALISHALRHPNHRYTIASHRQSHEVVYQTARTDLIDLRERGLVIATKVGRTWYYQAAKNLEQVLTKDSA